MMPRCPERYGASLWRSLLLVLVLALILLLGFGIWANADRDRDGDGRPDGVSLHVFDPSWWTATRDDARPLVDSARHGVAAARQRLFATGGLIDQAAAFYERNQALLGGEAADDPTAAPAAASASVETAVAATPAPEPLQADPLAGRLATAPTQHLLDNIDAAGEHFAAALVAWKRSDGAEDATARAHLMSVRLLLRDTLPVYAQRSDHDPAVLAAARELQERAVDLLLQADEAAP